MEIKMDSIKRTFTTSELWIAKVIHIPYCGYDGAKPRSEQCVDIMPDEVFTE